MKNRIIILLCMATVISCKSKPEEQKNFGRMDRFADQNIVETGFAREGTFFREFESNGKLEAIERATMKYEVDEDILSVDVKNGQQVEKGQTLSVLDNTQLRHNYEKSCRTVEKSRLGLEDALYNMGYELKDSLAVPEQVMKIALIRSGYTDAVSDKEMANEMLKKTVVKAPFAGVIAGLEAKPYNKAGQYKAFCILIDNSSFEVTFPVLENEAFKLSQGMKVMAIPYAFDGDTIAGNLTEINPMVDETGMVRAKAVIPNSTGKLTEGMNVKVILQEAIPNKLIIPKSAVTLRQERKVVFVCKNDTAYWNYVEVEEENSHSCTIRRDKIKPGEEVITDGNFNLSHLAPVVKMGN